MVLKVTKIGHFRVLQISPVLGGLSKSSSQLCLEIFGEKWYFLSHLENVKDVKMEILHLNLIQTI